MGLTIMAPLFFFGPVENTSIDDTPVDAFAYPISESKAVTIMAMVTARDIVDGTANSYTVIGSASRVGAAAPTLGAATPDDIHTEEADIDWKADIVLSGNDLVLRLTGEIGRTINWSATIQVVTA